MSQDRTPPPSDTPPDEGTDTQTGAKPRTDLRTWARDLALGARFTLAGGREGWTRTLLTAVGVGFGVAVLLLAAAVPAMMDARSQRSTARDDMYFGAKLPPAATTMLIHSTDTSYRGESVYGRVLRPDGAEPPIPPGLSKIPAPGEMTVSPALERLLDSPEGKLLKERLNFRVTGTIAKDGLLGPGELAYYAGSDTITDAHATRVDRIGGGHHMSAGLGAVLTLLVVIGLIVLLMPVAILIATAVRFGGETRDRRLAALRLVGADTRMTRRIAAGEALVGSLAGLVFGLGFFLVGRHFTGQITLYDMSVFSSDVRPSTGLALLIVLAVPAAAVAVTVFALRGIAIEPLGVVRNAGLRKRRLWWRLLIPVAGLALLAPLFGGVRGNAQLNEYQISAGAVLLLVGVTAALPWLVELVVNRFGGGPVPWQLATRRLQLNSGASARMVNGITIAVAGAIALQMLFSGIQDDFTSSTGKDPNRAQMQANMQVKDGPQATAAITAYRTTPGVRSALGLVQAYAIPDGAAAKAKAAGTPDAANDIPSFPVIVGDCAALSEIAAVSDCADGSVYRVLPDAQQASSSPPAVAGPGTRIDLNGPQNMGITGPPRLWTVPAAVRTVKRRTSPSGNQEWGILATPGALDVARLREPNAVVLLKLDAQRADAEDHVRNTTARLGDAAQVMKLQGTETARKFTSIKRGLLIGATTTLLMIGISLLVSMLEQLRERKKLLAVLVAFGTRRSTLGLSVLWQTALPVALGLAVAVVGGLGLGSVLLKMVGSPIRVDWASAATMTGVGAGVVLLVTLLSLPPLWRMMRPDGLRTE
ncbi:ABC transporter permease [Streptomyces sp. H10-C2]|uniref:FtsX-like permease family protein n=1 Tax=unclassified Streptomyces TaxID=2593676 RepID=UPI0024B9BD46|nr:MULTISPECIES: FtsX-like permease family protein [unclassified Streptomyces]MDJ0342730.1 ABC transporter permease [Streptomyces sp. PH10-H1]MDJ0372560.1 ABC transporter permease [Streptomyces sp. H10-C2]